MYKKLFDVAIENELTLTLHFTTHNCSVTPTFKRGNMLDSNLEAFRRFMEELRDEDTMRFDRIETLDFVNHGEDELAINIEIEKGFFCLVRIPRYNLQTLSVKPEGVYISRSVQIGDHPLGNALCLAIGKPITFF